MVSVVSREIGSFVRINLDYFQSYDRIAVYYDNGQKEITNLINTLFNAFLDAEVRKVKPSDYALFQAANMMCTLELLSAKLESSQVSKSETQFFGSIRNLKKNYLKPLSHKRL